MKSFTKILSTVVLLLLIIVPAFAQPELDLSFAGTGYKTTKLAPSRDDVARSVLIQPNGKILTGGNSFNSIGYSNIGIVRLKPNGGYDNNFGTGGIATITGGFFCDMALQSSGKIIVAGSGVGPTNVNNYIVYRLNKNGSSDTSFGDKGNVEVNIAGSGMICFDVAIQPDDKIVLAGYQGGSGGYGNMLIVRLTKGGKLDNTFGNNGMYTLYLSGKHSECRQLAIQPDGKIVAAGYIDTLVQTAFFRYDFAAVRLNANGTPDNTFGTNGIVRADKGTTDIAESVGLLSDGRIVLGGMSNYFGNTQVAALCLQPNGAIDQSFGSGGWKFMNFYGGTAYCEALAIEPDNDIVLAGPAYIPTSTGTLYGVGLSKLNDQGIPDNAFGSGGMDTSLVTNSYIGTNDVALQTDGKIVVGGYWNINGGKSSFFTARFSNSALLKEIVKNEIKPTVSIFPNPVTGSSFMINYRLTKPTDVLLTVFDLHGRVIYSCNYGMTNTGSYNQMVTLPGNIAAGAFFVRLTLSDVVSTNKIQIVK
ncbi:MAG: T9SS type A sorting domain-containing protein [Chitinophagales bacterium]|nr:T9SS type A sorting domain-containing protein [Chitinophagales bacterium]